MSLHWIKVRISIKKPLSMCQIDAPLFSISGRPFHNITSVKYSAHKNKPFRMNGNGRKFLEHKGCVKSLWDSEQSDKRTINEIDQSGPHDLTMEREERHQQEAVLRNKLTLHVQSLKTMKIEQWEDIRMAVLEIPGLITEENIDAIVINMCAELSLLLCKSYFTYLKSTQKKINRATYGNYLKSFHLCSSECTNDDLKEIDKIYQEMINKYPVLDSNTAQKAVFGICLTNNWKEYKNLFKYIKQFYHPSFTAYCEVIKTSFKNGEVNLGWDLLDEMKLYHTMEPDEVFQSWLANHSTDLDLKRLLDFLKTYNSKPSFELSQMIKNSFERISFSRKGTFSTISYRGVCRNCNARLEPACVSQQDYEHLKSVFLNPVLVGRDIFQKTQPQELNSFLQLLEKTAPYDVVLDGLNIAFKGSKYTWTPKLASFQLKSVVRHFTEQGQKVLVCGRKHMERWPQEDMRFIKNNACVFLAENISQDDPFLLYSTLYSGLGTRFVSQDLMRGHKFLLSDPKLQATFQKWQAQHQYFIQYIESSGFVALKDPVPFMQSIQKNANGDWHIPYEGREELTDRSRVDNYHKHWLCLTTRNSSVSKPKKIYEKPQYNEKFQR